MRLQLSSIARTTFIVLCVVVFVAPVAVIIPMSLSKASILYFPPTEYSLRWYKAFFESAQWRGAMVNSVIVATGTAVAATFLGVPAALGLMRLSGQARAVMTAFLLLPAIVPTIVSGIALYNKFATIGLSGKLLGIIAAHTMISLPFVVIYVLAALQKLDVRTVNAARSLGASPRKAFLLVTCPAILPGIAAGVMFAFVTSFGEVVIALFLSSPTSTTLPVQMWNGIRFEVNPIVAAASVAFMVVSVLLFSLTSLIMGKDR